ncbi:hypothetical protein BDN72DRAFT_749922, partial [Pluteus cervinus]
MISHVIAFESPIPKVYDKLPPSMDDLDEVLAILFTGPTRPTQKEFARTPLLVRKNYVMNALDWLKLNHSDYTDIEISEENMEQYPDDLPPVTIQYKQMDSNKVPETMDLINYDDEDGVDTGDCPFIVHGLSSNAITTETAESLKATALKHMNTGGKILAIGQSSQPESLYNNPSLYPQMFPWLFPYGVGGIGS